MSNPVGGPQMLKRAEMHVVEYFHAEDAVVVLTIQVQ